MHCQQLRRIPVGLLAHFDTYYDVPTNHVGPMFVRGLSTLIPYIPYTTTLDAKTEQATYVCAPALNVKWIGCLVRMQCVRAPSRANTASRRAFRPPLVPPL